MCSPAPMYSQAGAARGTGSASQQSTLSFAAFMGVFMDPTGGAVDFAPGGYTLQSGWTVARMQQALQAGLIARAPCWWPALMATAEAAERAASGAAPEAGNPTAGTPADCDGMLLTTTARKRYATTDTACPTSAEGISCASAVRNAMTGVLSPSSGTLLKMTQAQAYSLCEACGISAGIANPTGGTGLPKKTTLYIVLGVLALVLLIGGIVLASKASKLKHAALREDQ